MNKLEQLVDTEWSRASYLDQFAEEPTTGPPRLVISCSRSPLATVKRLAAVLDGPFLLLWILHTPGTAVARGRYQSPPLSKEDLDALLTEFGAFFEGDARGDVWLHTNTPATVVYECHDLIYAYGPLDQFAQTLTDAGFSKGRPSIPAPHAHVYHHEFDPAETNLAARSTGDIHRFNRVTTIDRANGRNDRQPSFLALSHMHAVDHAPDALHAAGRSTSITGNVNPRILSTFARVPGS